MGDDEELTFVQDIGGEEEDLFYHEAMRTPCFGVRIAGKEVRITRDNKTVLSLPKEQFPSNIDWNDTKTIGSMIHVIREQGLHALLSNFGIQMRNEP